ncbi:hypothetical protein H0H81_009049 [Sphagnurus paluster]|uniref:Uncharacterized protein n=1 Tax=Sphagnurus paluster TaxID=117069 RepID=A0A9P7FWJ4_9AGAR|nr:hypothetical protein H0H81_009049 [Sphagnurus paluster]
MEQQEDKIVLGDKQTAISFYRHRDKQTNYAMFLKEEGGHVGWAISDDSPLVFLRDFAKTEEYYGFWQIWA